MNNQIIERNLSDRNDDRWSHPNLVDTYRVDGRKSLYKMLDPDVSVETRRARRDKVYRQLEDVDAALLAAHPEYVAHADTKQYVIPGFAGEENAPDVRVEVRFPKKRRKKNNKVLFYIAGGGFVFGTPLLSPIEEYSYDLDCIVVSPWYRTALDAPYPAAMNDIYAAYAWMIDNSEELGISPDKVVLCGLSAGAFFSITMAFRLKRNGYRPRGLVVMDPVVDDRQRNLSCSYNMDSNDFDQARLYWPQYLGVDNWTSPALGPEAVPSRATVEDCKGVCPMVIHVPENDPARDDTIEFLDTVRAAGVYTEFHQWGGCSHSTYYSAASDNEQKQRYMNVFYGNIRDFWDYDMRREWLWNEGE